MLSRIFPKKIDNDYRGHWLGIAIFALIIVARLSQGANILFNAYDVAIRADGLPLDTYGQAAASTIVALIMRLGLLLLVLHLQGLVALIRYRAMIPLIYALLLIVQISSQALAITSPIARTSAQTMVVLGMPAGIFGNYVVLALLLLGFLLSLQKRYDVRSA